MSETSQASILHIDVLDEGLIIEFDDGTCSLYSAHLLKAMQSQADDLEPLDALE